LNWRRRAIFPEGGALGGVVGFASAPDIGCLLCRKQPFCFIGSSKAQCYSLRITDICSEVNSFENILRQYASAGCCDAQRLKARLILQQ